MDDADLQRSSRTAVSLVGERGDSRLHGGRSERGDGVQSAGGSADRCGESADEDASFAGGDTFQKQRGGVYGRLGGGICGGDTAVPAQSIADRFVRAGAAVFTRI